MAYDVHYTESSSWTNQTPNDADHVSDIYAELGSGPSGVGWPDLSERLESYALAGAVYDGVDTVNVVVETCIGIHPTNGVYFTEDPSEVTAGEEAVMYVDADFGLRFKLVSEL